MSTREPRQAPRRALVATPTRLRRGVAITAACALLVAVGAVAASVLQRQERGLVTVTATAGTTVGIDEVPAGAAVGAGEWTLPPLTLEELPAPEMTSGLYDAQSARLNALPVLALTGCPRPVTVSTRAQWKAAVTGQWECLARTWAPVLKENGLSTDVPEVSFYSGEGSDSGCGWIDAPAFYCSAGGGTAHFGTDHYEMAREWDLSVNEMVNHEYAHHLQALFGITAVKVAGSAGDHELDRRAELQATCISAALTRHNDAVSFGQAVYDGWLHRLGTMVADEIHGSQDSLLSWGTRGLYATTYGDCNTWVADASEVS